MGRVLCNSHNAEVSSFARNTLFRIRQQSLPKERSETTDEPQPTREAISLSFCTQTSGSIFSAVRIHRNRSFDETGCAWQLCPSTRSCSRQVLQLGQQALCLIALPKQNKKEISNDTHFQRSVRISSDMFRRILKSSAEKLNGRTHFCRSPKRRVRLIRLFLKPV